MKRNLIFIFIIFLSNAFILLNNHKYEMFENGVYLSYLESLLADGDFNIFNQMTNSFDQWMVTQTYHHPDYHSPFVGVMLLPGYLLYFLNSLFFTSEQMATYFPFQIFIFTRLLILVFIAHICRKSQENELFTASSLLLLLSSFSWLTFFDASEISFLCLFFTFPIFMDLKSLFNGKQIHEWRFALNLALFACIKPDALPWIAGVSLGLIMIKQTGLLIKTGLLVSLSIAQFLLINWIRYEQLAIPHPAVFFYPNSILHIFFGYNGMLYKSPILLITFIGLWIGLFQSSTRKLSLVGLSIILIKAFILGGALPTDTEEIANRLFLAELPWYGFGLLIIKDKIKISYRTLITIFTPISLFILFMWLTDLLDGTTNYRIRTWIGSPALIGGLTHVRDYYLNVYQQLINNFSLICYWSLIAGVIVFGYSYLLKRNEKFKLVQLYLLFALVFLSSAINLFFNQRNIDVALARGDYKQSVVAQKEALFYDEVMDLIHYSELQVEYNRPIFHDLEKFKENYIEKVKLNIVEDPIGFLDDLNKKIYRKSFWQAKYPNE